MRLTIPCMLNKKLAHKSISMPTNLSCGYSLIKSTCLKKRKRKKKVHICVSVHFSISNTQAVWEGEKKLMIARSQEKKQRWNCNLNSLLGVINTKQSENNIQSNPKSSVNVTCITMPWTNKIFPLSITHDAQQYWPEHLNKCTIA